MTTFTTEDRINAIHADRIRVLFLNLADDCLRVAKESNDVQTAISLGLIRQEIQKVARNYEEYNRHTMENKS